MTELTCKRCGTEMTYRGWRKLDVAPLSIKDLFVWFEYLDFYVCNNCGALELFDASIHRSAASGVPIEISDEEREAAGEYWADRDDLKPGVPTWPCDCGEINVMSEVRCRRCDGPRPEQADIRA